MSRTIRRNTAHPERLDDDGRHRNGTAEWWSRRPLSATGFPVWTRNSRRRRLNRLAKRWVAKAERRQARAEWMEP